MAAVQELQVVKKAATAQVEAKQKDDVGDDQGPPPGTPFFFFKQKTAYELSSRDWSSDVCSSDLIALTMPSPTRAMIVSSVAPPTKRSRCERTVTRAFTLAPMPSLATPSMVVRPIDGLGTSITLGLMLVRTASSTVLPVPLVARSMAHARLKSSAIPALSAAINARITWPTSPPAR